MRGAQKRRHLKNALPIGTATKTWNERRLCLLTVHGACGLYNDDSYHFVWFFHPLANARKIRFRWHLSAEHSNQHCPAAWKTSEPLNHFPASTQNGFNFLRLIQVPICVARKLLYSSIQDPMVYQQVKLYTWSRYKTCHVFLHVFYSKASHG